MEDLSEEVSLDIVRGFLGAFGKKLGEQLEASLSRYHIQRQDEAKSLGVGMTAGRKRPSKVTSSKLRMKRLPTCWRCRPFGNAICSVHRLSNSTPTWPGKMCVCKGNSLEP